MRTRTSHSPDGWRDDGPGRAALSGYSGSLVVGEPGAEERSKALLRAQPETPRRAGATCGYFILRRDAPCGRGPEHRGDHRPSRSLKAA